MRDHHRSHRMCFFWRERKDTNRWPPELKGKRFGTWKEDEMGIKRQAEGKFRKRTEGSKQKKKRHRFGKTARGKVEVPSLLLTLPPTRFAIFRSILSLQRKISSRYNYRTTVPTTDAPLGRVLSGFGCCVTRARVRCN